MIDNFEQRSGRTSQTCCYEENLGFPTSEAVGQKKSDDSCIISLTSCYKHQWKVVFSEKPEVPSLYSSVAVAPKTEKATVVCR